MSSYVGFRKGLSTAPAQSLSRPPPTHSWPSKWWEKLEVASLAPFMKQVLRNSERPSSGAPWVPLGSAPPPLGVGQVL